MHIAMICVPAEMNLVKLYFTTCVLLRSWGSIPNQNIKIQNIMTQLQLIESISDQIGMAWPLLYFCEI